MIVLTGVITLCIIGLLGFALVSGLLGDVPLHRAERIGLSFAAGYGLLGVVLFDGSLCHCIPCRAELAGAALMALAALIALRRPPLNARGAPPAERPSAKLSGVLLAVSIALIGAAGLNVLAASLAPGLADIDMFGIWMFRAKLLATQALLPLPTALTDPTLSYSHQDYPMGMPAVVAAVYAIVGRVDEHVAMATLLLPIWFAVTAVLYGSLRRRVSRAVAAALVSAFVASPVVVYHSGLAVAEMPLVLMHACTLVMLLQWVQTGSRRDLIATAAFAAFTAFIKNEGMALLPIVGGVGLGITLLRRPRGWVVDWLWAAATVVVLIGPWLLYRRWLPHTHEDYGGRLSSAHTLADTLPRAGAVFRAYFGYIWQLGTAGPTWVLLLGTAALYPKAWAATPTRGLWTILLAHWALYGVIFTITPWAPAQLMPMVAPKLLMHIAPAAVLLIGLHLQSGHSRPT